MAGSTGFEPATSGLTVQCANQAAPRARFEFSKSVAEEADHTTEIRGGAATAPPPSVDQAAAHVRPLSSVAPLERPAAAAAGAAARRAAAPAARAEPARPAREAAGAGRQERLGRLAAEGRDAGVVGVERERGRPRVPHGLVHLEALPAEDPALGDAERDRPRQEPVERVRRHPLEPILLRALEKLLKAAHRD